MRLTLIILCATIGLASGAGVLPDNSVNAFVGDTVKFSTSLAQTQTQLYSISWKYGAKNIASFLNSTILIDPEYKGRISLFPFTGDLQLNNVTLSDSGEYSVSIRPAVGDTAKPGLTTLNIYERITNITLSPTFSPIEGSSANFKCDGLGVTKREWTINGVVAEPSENIVFFDQMRELVIVVVNRTDTGTVRCSLSNPMEQFNFNFVVNVNYGPDPVQISGPEKIRVGETLKLSCSAESVPGANYTWIKNGTTVAGSQEFIKEKCELLDGGEYTCRATNKITEKSSEGKFTVLVSARKKGLSPGAAAGITVATLMILAGAAIGGFFLYKHMSGE